MSAITQGLRRVKLDLIEREYAIQLAAFVEMEPEVAAHELVKLRIEREKLLLLVRTTASAISEDYPKTAQLMLEELGRIVE